MVETVVHLSFSDKLNKMTETKVEDTEALLDCFEGLENPKSKQQAPFSCNKCDFQSETGFGLKSHKKKHVAPQKKCKDCELTFKKTDALLNHILETHGDLECPECKEPFQSRVKYMTHLKVSHKESAYRCKLCGKTYGSQKGFERHMNCHFGLKPHKCDMCPKAFADATTMRRHRKLKHCSSANESFEKVVATCPYCGKGFYRRVNLESHITKVHTDGGDNTDTDIEEEDKELLREHLKDRAVTFAKTNSLEETSKKFSVSLHQLKTWVRLAVNPFICELCSKEFSTIANLSRHKQQVHMTREEVEEEKRLKQDELLRKQEEWKRNLEGEGRSLGLAEEIPRSVTRDPQDEIESEEMFKCEMCDFSAVTKAGLNNHIRKHNRLESGSGLVKKEEERSPTQLERNDLGSTIATKEEYRSDDDINNDGMDTGIGEDVASSDEDEDSFTVPAVSDSMSGFHAMPCVCHPGEIKELDPDPQPEVDIKELKDDSHHDVKGDSKIFDLDPHFDPGAERIKSEQPTMRKTKCPHCEVRVRNVIDHIVKDHRKAQIFNCDLCEYQGPKKDNLWKHMKRTHEGAVFVCNSCPKRYKLRCDLKEHKRSTHGDLNVI